MHLNYHFLTFLCPALKDAFSGKKIRAAFSQNKDELILEAESKGESKFIRAHLLPPQVYLSFPDNFQRAKRNSIDLFKEIIGEEICTCQVLQFERAFYFGFVSGKILLVKLHGNRSNVLLYEKDAFVPHVVFRNEIVEDKALDWRSLDQGIPLDYDRFFELEGNASKFLPTLGSTPRAWLKEQGYQTSSIDIKWELIQELLDMLQTPLFSLTAKSGEIQLSLLPEDGSLKTFSDPIEAVNELFYQALVKGNFEKEKQSLLKKYQDQLKKNRSYIEKASRKLEELKNSPPPSQLADVIMANLHVFQEGRNEADLVDFYSGDTIKVSLKPQQKPQDLAAMLYRKSKNRKLEWAQLEKTISQKQAHVEDIGQKIQELQETQHFKALKSFKKSNQEDKILQKNTAALPFKIFAWEGHTIWVGKSAKANDEMLRNFAKKDDIWLHARMVAGSHVLIKVSGMSSIPGNLLETAAQLAAFYSKNKSETLAPVIYTEVKYVRKVKGAPAGSVLVEKEKVLMVSPKGPEELFGKPD